MKTLFNKNKRGFSLVELMVVVAIMGTLASIAIPAFNEYRRSAKKNAYRADLSSLHKGWIAFGVEIDSFCERETLPRDSSIESVGMISLRSSKLYGGTAAVPASCSSGTLVPTGCDPNAPGNCTSCSSTTATFTAFTPPNGPGKDNFIGFGSDSTRIATANTVCPSTDLPARQVREAGTTVDNTCILNVEAYRMGVAGHVSGAVYYGATINNNGVTTDEEGASSAIFMNGGVCT